MTRPTPSPDVASNSPFPTSVQMDRMKKDGIAPTKASVPSHGKVAETSIDNGVEESFPASDPVSVSITKVEKAAD
ncbi:hypothetical protein [Xylophilus ampelinus]|uniref:Uncharacterized protein n=1 Tax=Xylophilus ampelinus TaxID=54067 RepID=A0A318T2B8_9BURK|nr:hypothetical protein [Xylophilus ampelinus]MCS4509222.1 hypothetical protein [Xylophilus ampelinus]PYE79751.1 hypothetical protein DFQ15_10171 [Xylophilus ampelinus]